MIAAVCLVVIPILAEESVTFRALIWKSADCRIFACFLSLCKIFCAGLVHGNASLIARFFAVVFVEVAFVCYAAHVVHCHYCGCLDSCVNSCCVECPAAPATDSDDADFFRVNVWLV